MRALCLAGIRFYRTSSSFILPPTRFYTIQIAQGGKEDEEKNTLAHQESQRNCNWIFIFKLGTIFKEKKMIFFHRHRWTAFGIYDFSNLIRFL